ncbi:unnamed protein product (macronuclear) [Paramecium tetraurelia]|uniref:AN1-type domain-containing protein n=1 Tax=Paramecium tetraurelia TaxID=5888 RepID=A0D8Q8_PARTE|nr:uncharacterized protein GSPATT00014371001 [Paramecium tetraurelia]CAK79425.1 unnamed protein product [Paramecium tetraurelia]|eukprot:XP_001446822.1 hypothetical protein (macronuclear) [Paramecium tetraurelia strain d4-2]
MLDHNIGQRCKYSICRQKDFLPYECSLCKDVYCQEHRTQEAHECPKLSIKKSVILCPLCKKGLCYTSDQNENTIWEEHFEKDCPQQPKEKKVCPICKDKLTDVTNFKCKDCGMEVCLKHRYREDHKCPTLKKIESQENQSPNSKDTSNENVKTFQQLLKEKLEYQQHYQQKNSTQSCPVCEQKFPNIMLVIRHVESHHS